MDTALTPVIALLLTVVTRGGAIDCFSCHSRNGSVSDCEDSFAAHNATGYLLQRNCHVGLLRLKANYCIKIKGTNTDSGERVVIRTCSMDNWGSVCGEVRLLQPTDQQQQSVTEAITGCLATCNYDGCNEASLPSTSWAVILTLALSVLASARDS